MALEAARSVGNKSKEDVTIFPVGFFMILFLTNENSCKIPAQSVIQVSFFLTVAKLIMLSVNWLIRFMLIMELDIVILSH